MDYEQEIKEFLSLFGINSMSNMNAQKIKIHEILKILRSDDSYTMPNKANQFTRKCLKEFLNNSYSTYAATQILFGATDYSYNIIFYPKETAKFSNIFLADMKSKFNIVMPNDFPLDVLTNTLLLKYFPIEWIAENLIINKDNIVICYNNEKKRFYLKKFNSKNSIYQTALSTNVSSIEKAIKLDKLQDIYYLYLEKDA